MIRRSPIRRKRSKPRRGKQIIRLHGAEMTALRDACMERDGGRCVVCGSRNKLAMAHIHAKRNGGDTLDNVRMLCHFHHTAEHAYGKEFKKPCPPKPVMIGPGC